MSEERSCFRIEIGNKNLMVCVSPSKNAGEMDIILINDNAARSMRSMTELVNMLLKEGAGLDIIDETITQIRRRMNYKQWENKLV